MLKFFKFIGYFLERSEINYPRIFWSFTCLSGIFLFYQPVQTFRQSQIAIEQVFAGGQQSKKKRLFYSKNLKSKNKYRSTGSE